MRRVIRATIVVGARIVLTALLAVTLLSWALSGSHRYGVLLERGRAYALCAEAGHFEFRRILYQDVDFINDPKGGVREIPFNDGAMLPTVRWIDPASVRSVWRPKRGNASWPTLRLRASPWPQTADASSYGVRPVVRSLPDATTETRFEQFGHFTAVLAIPYWLVVAGLSIPFALSLIARRRPREVGTCRRCGYDLRETPIRCPECGTPVKSERLPFPARAAS